MPETPRPKPADLKIHPKDRGGEYTVRDQRPGYWVPTPRDPQRRTWEPMPPPGTVKTAEGYWREEGKGRFLWHEASGVDLAPGQPRLERRTSSGEAGELKSEESSKAVPGTFSDVMVNFAHDYISGRRVQLNPTSREISSRVLGSVKPGETDPAVLWDEYMDVYPKRDIELVRGGDELGGVINHFAKAAGASLVLQAFRQNPLLEKARQEAEKRETGNDEIFRGLVQLPENPDSYRNSVDTVGQLLRAVLLEFAHPDNKLTEEEYREKGFDSPKYIRTMYLTGLKRFFEYTLEKLTVEDEYALEVWNKAGDPTVTPSDRKWLQKRGLKADI